jgi:hypothetical protein
MIEPAILDIEQRLTEKYGTRVQVEKREDKGGRVTIQFFSEDDLKKILEMLESSREMEKMPDAPAPGDAENEEDIIPPETIPEKEPEQSDEDMYFVKNFSL